MIEKMKTLVIVVLCVLCAAEAGASIRRAQEEQIRNLPIEYRRFAEACLEKGSSSCCFSSARAMATGNYQPAAVNNGIYECPGGYVAHVQGCGDSSQWCKPEKKESK